VERSSKSHYQAQDIAMLFKLSAKDDKFTFSARSAALFLTSLPTITIGKNVLVTRTVLLDCLTALEGAKDPADLLREMKGKIQAQKRKPPKRAEPNRKVNWSRVREFLQTDLSYAALPDNVELAKGELTVRFFDTVDVIETLAWLAGFVRTDVGLKAFGSMSIGEPEQVDEEEAKRIRLEREEADLYTNWKPGDF
jgi:hypothetical protein